jgi:hypothetical protein
MSGTPGYPLSLPRTVVELIDQLDQQVPIAIIDAPPLPDARIQELMFEAGRRSIVDELVRLKERSQKNG